MMKPILFVNHKAKNCGVYQYGYNIWGFLKESKNYNFIYAECLNKNDLVYQIQKFSPVAIIYNYHPSTLPWLDVNVTKLIDIPQIGMIHEVTQNVADMANKSLFDYHIAPDPTLLLKNPIVFKTGRPIPRYENIIPIPDTLTIGSFGFAHKTKGFDRIIELVQNEFDNALIRLHITTPYGASEGKNEYLRIVKECKSKIYKKGIMLEIDSDFLDTNQLLDFLAGNSINVFLYENQQNRGISSAIDYALAVKRPIAISNSNMFRHVLTAIPSICISNNSLSDIIANRTMPLQKFYDDWSSENLVWEYERIINNVLDNFMPVKRRPLNRFQRILNRCSNILFGRVYFHESYYFYASDWIATDIYHPIEFNSSNTIDLPKYTPVKDVNDFNIILNDAARKKYNESVMMVERLCPDIIKRKIPRANIQQGFVLDSVYRFSKEFVNPKILCVGCYEDTAAYSLAKLGIHLDVIDPIVNYDLSDFLSRPSTKKGYYDIVFSTSVIEHVANDEQFIKDISSLLTSKGIAILTCDYKDSYKPGDDIPRVCYRFYTKYDLEHRLMNAIPECKLFGKTKWECDSYDFIFDKFQYTFATLVFQKSNNLVKE